MHACLSASTRICMQHPCTCSAHHCAHTYVHVQAQQTPACLRLRGCVYVRYILSCACAPLAVACLLLCDAFHQKPACASLSGFAFRRKPAFRPTLRSKPNSSKFPTRTPRPARVTFGPLQGKGQTSFAGVSPALSACGLLRSGFVYFIGFRWLHFFFCWDMPAAVEWGSRGLRLLMRTVVPPPGTRNNLGKKHPRRRKITFRFSPPLFASP